jgi:hypothetical protein
MRRARPPTPARKNQAHARKNQAHATIQVIILQRVCMALFTPWRGLGLQLLRAIRKTQHDA